MEVMHHSASFLLPPVSSKQGSSLTYALVILNQHLPRFTPLLWNHAKLRVCADGGANRVYDEMTQFFPQQDPLDIRQRYKPDVIKGDMDSIRPEVLDFYAKLGCDAIDESHDQDTTDLHKCISYISNSIPDSEKLNTGKGTKWWPSTRLATNKIIKFLFRSQKESAGGYSSMKILPVEYFSQLCILVTGGLGGRFDHEAGNINVLYRFSNTRIILLSDDCLIQVLPRTHQHEIHIQSSVVGPHCGLIPIGMPSGHSTTSGLKWNLADTEMKFGGLVSTSNIVNGDTVTVQSDSDLLWTISIKSDNKDMVKP